MTDPTPPASLNRPAATRRPARLLATAALGVLLLAGAYAGATALAAPRPSPPT
ncbi:hypothetical protein [Deinococcus aquaticus]|uniref:Uncharacterized protein n=1 Tax=Deinococcus aquaticus TaxID=328692 RepID=A0ABY7V034_9DEIO|nr:hypothetical protein [Deinococcus aquaticus]WDA57999.1 hypothetical protein M8445_11650 [Deinococcus aquaticus]